MKTSVARFAVGNLDLRLRERNADEAGQYLAEVDVPEAEAGWSGVATFQVMRRTFATLSKAAGVDAHTRSAQMGNTVDVNENEYAVASFEQKLAAVRRLESVVIQSRGREHSNVEAF